MSQVCTCPPDKVKVIRPTKGDPYCNVCGHWWMPQHGSQVPTDNNVYGGVPRSKSEFGKADATVKRVVGKYNTSVPTIAKPPATGRNEPCTCGSGKKFKKCCGNPATQKKPLAIVVPTQTDSDNA